MLDGDWDAGWGLECWMGIGMQVPKGSSCPSPVSNLSPTTPEMGQAWKMLLTPKLLHHPKAGRPKKTCWEQRMQDGKPQGSL